MPLPHVVWPEAYCFCPVRPCVRPETLLTRYLAEYLTHFHRTYIKDAEMNASQFGLKRSKVKVKVE